MWNSMLPVWLGGWRAKEGEEAEEDGDTSLPIVPEERHSLICSQLRAQAASTSGRGGGGGASHSQLRDPRVLAELYSRSVRLTRHAARRLLSLIDEVSRHLLFWEVRAQGAQAAKLRFMLLERGPIEFGKGIARMSKQMLTRGKYCETLTEHATRQIAERESLLRLLRDRLASALGDIHKCAALPLSKFSLSGGDGGGGFPSNPRAVISSSLTSIQLSLYNLEDSYDLPETPGSSGLAGVCGSDDSRGVARVVLSLVEMGLDLRRTGSWSEWNDEEIAHAIHVLYENVSEVGAVVGRLVGYCGRPSRLARRWVRYAGMGMVVGTATGFLIRNSDRVESWAQQGKDATKSFWHEHVLQPLALIKDDLFTTFRSRPKGIVDVNEVKLTEASLRRMMLAFVEDVVTAKRISDDASEQELMEMVMKRYEEDVMHPVRNLLTGEIMRSVLIQVQKLKLNTETAMLELNQLLRANELNFAFLAAVPALMLAFAALEVARRTMSTAQGESTSAIRRRRMLFADVDRAILACHVSLLDSQEQNATGAHGMLLYKLDKLYKAARRSAMENREWRRLKNDLVLLSHPDVGVEQKLVLASSMSRSFESLGVVALPVK